MMPQVDLRDLSPNWVRNKRQEIVGISFRCPACPKEKLHVISVGWKDKEVWGRSPLWEKSGGDTFETLVLDPSIDGTKGGCSFHGWVRNGSVTW